MTRERIQKVIANAGIASRRGGEELIRAGRVTVDGRSAIIGEQVDPDMQHVEVDGRVLPAVSSKDTGAPGVPLKQDRALGARPLSVEAVNP